MDPIITTIASKIAISLTEKGLKEAIGHLFPELAPGKDVKEIRDGINVLKLKEFKAASDWLKQASIRASTDASKCMWQAEVEGKLALGAISDIKIKIQAYSICILAGYYNSSEGGKNLKVGKETAIDYLKSLRNEINVRFNNLTTDQIKEKTKRKIISQLKKGSIAIVISMPFLLPLITIIIFSGTVSKTVRDTVLNSFFIPKKSKFHILEIFEMYVESNTELRDKIYCEQGFTELEIAVKGLPYE